MSPLTETVRITIARHRMLETGQKVLVAVSGGPDSIAMLHVLSKLAPALGITLAVAHLDHGFRPESTSEAEFVRNSASSLGVEFVSERSDLRERLKSRPANKQAAARDARYAFFDRAAAMLGADKVSVGHTADDQAETYLMRELRGSGVQGLSAIPPVRGKVIRPLIGAGREEVMAYLNGKGITFVTDPSNARPDYLRNRLRLELIPLLKRYNPRLLDTLSQSADILREEDEFLSAYTEDLMGAVGEQGPDGTVSLDLKALMGLPVAIKRRILRQAVRRVKGDLLGVDYGHIMDAARLASGVGTGRGIDLPGGVRAETSYGRLLVHRRLPGGEAYLIELPVPGSVAVPQAGMLVEAELPIPGAKAAPAGDAGFALFDLDRLKGPLVVRNRRDGDYFCPTGMSGRKKLKDYFIDSKLPRALRSRAPVLASGGEIAWVIGMRLDRRFAADARTKRAVKVSFQPEGAR